jgi:hypothetical protein
VPAPPNLIYDLISHPGEKRFEPNMAEQAQIEALIDEALNRQIEGGHHTLWDCLAV